MKLTRLLLIASVVSAAYVCVVMCMVQPWLIVLIAIAAIAVAAKKKSTALWAHGTARWCDATELKAAGMLDADSGIIIGKVHMPKTKLRAMIALFNRRIVSLVACEEFLAILGKGREKAQVRLNAIHTMVVAPTGVGKGASFVIPHLLTSPDSTVVVDYKGENFRATAEHRRTKYHHTIVVLDPFKVVTQTPDSFNPLDFIDGDNPLAIDDCRDLAESLVVRTGLEKEAHWADSAELWIWAMIAVVVLYSDRKDRSLQSVRKLLTNPDKMQAVIKLMCESNAWSGMLSRLGDQLTQFRDRELGSVLTTANRFARFMDTLAIFDSTSSSSFNPADLLKGRMTIYLILPPEHMRTQSPLLRMWIGSMLRAIVRGGIQEKHKIHFLLDEAASLGRMEALDDAVDKYRAFGVRLQFYYQSLGQLKKCWPEGGDQTLLSNTSQIYFGVNDNETAKYVSERLGESTIAVRSGGSNTGRTHQTSDDGSASTSYSTGTSDNWSQQGRHLLKPEEVMALSERIAIIFTPGVAPIWTNLNRYFEMDFFTPSRQQGLWHRTKLFVAAFLLFIFASILAVGATGVAKENSERRVKPQQHMFYP